MGQACLESRERAGSGGSSHLAASQASAHKRHIDGHLHRAQHEAGRPPSFRGCGSATGPSAHAPGPWSALAGPSGATAASAMFWNPRLLRTFQKKFGGGAVVDLGPP